MQQSRYAATASATAPHAAAGITAAQLAAERLATQRQRDARDGATASGSAAGIAALWTERELSSGRPPRLRTDRGTCCWRPNGRILAYLQPDRGVNLDAYVGRPMGIMGLRTYRSELQTDLIIVRGMIPVRLVQQ